MSILLDGQVPYDEVAEQMQRLGFERGWGDTVGRARETLRLLADILQAPEAQTLQVRALIGCSHLETSRRHSSTRLLALEVRHY